ncbi:MAG TPA: PH domain-containing protein, partial [Cryptosporangiaceae bacterium]|nr:PH domain-containing protein [Cryptosporangiaceae bacterium]
MTGPLEVAPATGSAVVPDPRESGGSTDEYRRLHPLTPLVRGVRTFGIVTALLSYQAWRAPNLEVVLLLVAVGIVGGFAVSWVSWRFTGYRVDRRELRVIEGVLARRHRTVPLERVQAVDVVQPLLARLVGLAEVRLEVVGGAETEAPLAYLSRSEAEALRTHLLRLVSDARGTDGAVDARPGGGSAAADGPGQPGGPTVQRTLFTVDRRALVVSQLLTPNALAVPFLAIYPVREFLGNEPSLAAVFAFLSGIAGVVLVPIRRVLGEWGYTLREGPDGLTIRRGLLDVSNQTFPRTRIQAVRVRRPLLWRPFGWIRVEVDIAGYGGGNDQQSTGALVPVAVSQAAFATLHDVMPAVPADGPDALGLHPAPPAARWRAPLQASRLGYGVTPEVLVTRYGWPMLRHDIAVHARAQSIRVSEGPWQRALGLASVHLDLAGSQTRPKVRHRAEVEA